MTVSEQALADPSGSADSDVPTESALILLDTIVDGIVASSQPAVTFSSLAESCVPLLGSWCEVHLVEDSGVSYRIERPAVSERLLTGNHDHHNVVGASLRGASVTGSPEGSYSVKVSCHCPTGRTRRAEQEIVLQHAVDHAGELIRRERIQAAFDAEHALSASLRSALSGSREIGVAIGFLMHAGGLTHAEAFNALSTVSQHTNRKVREIAEELVRTGRLP